MSTQPLISRWLARLSVSRKLMLIYLLDLSAVVFITTVLVQEQFIAIDFTRKEVAGNQYIGGVRDGLVEAARARPDAAALVNARDTLTATEAAHGSGLLSGELKGRLANAYTAMLQTRVENQTPSTGDVIVQGRALITRVGNQSNLILDPDLDSYYTMSLVVLRLPELLELVHTVRQQTQRWQAPGTQAIEQGNQYLMLKGRLETVRQAIDRDLSEAVAAGGPALAGHLNPAYQRLQQALNGLGNLVDDLSLPAERRQADVLAAMPAAHAAVLDAMQNAWSVSGGALDDLLQARVAGLYHRMSLRLATALAMLGVILGLVYVVARHIVVPLKQLTGVTNAVRLSGDHSRRADWQSDDEIGQLVLGFNDMLAQLDHEREAQKERTAIERAAAAQRTLIEALPVPMVVTDFETHELLHSNARGRAWVGEHLTDIWAHGLEPGARERLFSGLSNLDGVTEFDVRWHGGTTPVWTVLSAQRLRYQGRDAVLAAFAPVDRMQVMEHNLDLWGKVFEASNEGILILDGQHRIVAANQAFEQQTGHAQGSLKGVQPGPLLALGDIAAAGGDLWLAASRHGGWRGEVDVMRLDGTRYPAWLMVAAVRTRADADLAPFQALSAAKTAAQNYIATFIDITERKHSEERIRYLAEHDALTGLPNRAVCEERLRMALQVARRNGQKVAVLFLDLDHFKVVNDTLGHHAGDDLLKRVAGSLLGAVRSGDTVSRLGGDEFVVVLNGLSDVNEIAQIVDGRLVPALGEVHSLEDCEMRVGCSVGVAIFPDDGEGADELMRQADTAMYQAKADGRNAVRFFDADMTERVQSRRRLESDLRQAMPLDQLALHWQPRVDAGSGRLVGVEGLLRWQHPVRGMVPPDQFIWLAEETGLIVPIGAWVIEEACRQIAAWRKSGMRAFGVSVNLSARQLADDGLIETVRGSMARHGVGPGVLELELTESMVMAGAERNLRQMQALRDLGVSLSIDDFGTGYSSLAYLSQFPIDKLKVDRSFVLDMIKDTTGRAITLAVIGLGHTLGLKVVAEGVEEARMADMLREARCDELQGYLFARPMPAAQLTAWLARNEVKADGQAYQAIERTESEPSTL
jgi:diguanylate cyclase (GGDEF)-like protein/PAS domain S-box-containing protein